MFCTNCGVQLPDDSTQCSQCNAPVEHFSKPNSGIKKVGIGILVVLVLIGIYAGIKTYSSKVAEEKLDEFIAKYASDADIDYKKVSVDLLGSDLRISDISLPNPVDANGKIRINEILINDIDDNSNIPSFLTMECNGLELSRSGRSDEVTPLSNLWYNDRIKGNIKVDYSYDNEKRELNVKKLRLKIEQACNLDISFRIGNIDLEPEAIAKLSTTYPQLVLHEAKITYEDNSLLDRTMKDAAKIFRVSEADYKKLLMQGVEQIIAGTNDESAKKALNEMLKFYENPKGLFISASPSTPLQIGALTRRGGVNPTDIIKLLNIQIKSEAPDSRTKVGNLYAEKFKEGLQDVAKDLNASQTNKPAEHTKLPYFAKAKVTSEVTLYSNIAGKPTNTTAEFVTEGYPTGKELGVLKPGTIVELMQMYTTWGEQPHTFKVKTERGTVGYMFPWFNITEVFGDRGAIILIHYNEGGEFEGNIEAVDKALGEYAKFVRDYPDSEFVPEALLKIVGLHLYTLQSDVDKGSRLDKTMAILKKLSADTKYSTNFRNATNTLSQYISEHRNELLAKEVKYEIFNGAQSLQGACLSHVPNSMR